MKGRQLFLTLSIMLALQAASLAEDAAMRSDANAMATKALRTCPDFFPIMPWDPLHGWKRPFVSHRHGLKSMAECDFTMGGFVKAEDLRETKKLGLKVLIFPDVEDAGAWMRGWKKLSDGEIDARIKTLVKKTGRNDAVLGYFITDEPGASSFPALAKAVAAVKKYAPGKLAYINLFPGYATIGAPDQSQLETPSFAEYLERFVREVKPQILSYDNYMVQYSMDLAKADAAARYYNDLMEVRHVAQEHSLPFWSIVSSNQIRPHAPIPSPANLAFQAYTTLAAGGRGVTWYTYYARGYSYAPIDDTDRKTMTWYYLQTVNHQVKTLGPVMNRLESTGVFFTSPPQVKGLPVLPERLVTEIQSDVPMMLGEFKEQDGVRPGDSVGYCMVVNLSLERSTCFVLKTGGKPIDGFLFSPENGCLLPLDNERGTWLVAGQGALIKATKTEEQ
ncbi:MAG: hypothetical protein NTU83_08595 [Candidatus Hydrogenedentes bacterium]|nr:hypothetical protein [Candidatus Hydrogenedentota bacterium]